jgi:RNA ligase (TIGR02306 family)
MERKLASVQVVSNLVPIEGADFIEMAVVGGWHTIVKKGEFTIGGLAIFLEVDSVLNPDLCWVQEYASFMEARKWRVKTLKMKGVLSQGLLIPMSVLGEFADATEDTDVTEALGIVKYEVPEFTGVGRFTGRRVSTFPTHLISKTDETRIQSKMKLLSELKGLPYYITEKADGSSVTYVTVSDEVVACSRNNMLDKENTFWETGERYDLLRKLTEHPEIALQAEIIGPGIQKNRYNLYVHELRFFNAYNLVDRRYLDFEGLVRLCLDWNLPMVEVVECGDCFDYTLEQLLELAKGKYPGTSNDREGIVVRPQDETYSQSLQGRLSFKVLNNDFLLKEK